MIHAFNALISCFTTALFVVLLIKLFHKLGWLPLISVVMPLTRDEYEREQEYYDE